MRFHNDTTSVLHVNDLGCDVGPLEDFDWPEWTPANGVVPGCTPLDPLPKADESHEDGGQAGTPAGKASAPAGTASQPPSAGSGQPATTPPAAKSASGTSTPDTASEENQP